MLTILQANNSLPELYNCWFGYSRINACFYNPLNPPVYFSLGEAIGAVALFIAAYQLSKPSWKIAFAIRKKWQRWLPLSFLILGFFMIFISSLLSQIPFYSLKPPLNYSLFYEMTGFILFGLAPSSYVFFSQRTTKLFNKRTYKNFFQVLLRETARTTPETQEAVVNIIGNNLTEIAKQAKRDESVVFIRNEIEKEAAKKPERVYANYASSVLNVILSEKKIASYIATARLDFLFHFISEIKKNSLDRSIAITNENISKALFEDTNSHLYSQLNYGGLALSANLYRTMFYDQQTLNIIRPLSNWNSWLLEDQSLLMDKGYLDVYLKALKNAVEGYWFNPKSDQNIWPFNSGFQNLGDYARNIVIMAIRDSSKKSIVSSRLGSVASFIGTDFMQFYEKAIKEKKIAENDIKVLRDRGKYSESLTAYYSELVFEFLETLAMIKNDDEDIRLTAYHATDRLFGVSVGRGEAFDNLRKDTTSLIWKKIKENVERGHFPAILKVYLSLVAFPSEHEDEPVCEERNKLIGYIEKELAPRILKDEKMGNKKDIMERVLLPENIVFNRQTKKFNWVWRDGSQKELVVKPCIGRVEKK